MKLNTVMCRFCRTPLGHTFVDLGMSPVANDNITPKRENIMEPFYPLCVYVCSKCLLVQLPDIRKEEEIFTDEYAYFSSFSTSWLAHCQKYTDMMIQRFHINKNNQVIEVASNDGYLLQYFKEKGIPVLGIEPTKNTAKVAIEKGIPTITEFFGADTAEKLVREGTVADLLLGNNVLAHVPDLNDFIKGVKIALKENGIFTFEFPHLLQLMQKNQFDTIYHEHYSYFSFTAVEQIFISHGLKLFDVEQLPTHGGSLRIFGTHNKNSQNFVGDEVARVKEKERLAGLTVLSGYSNFSKRVHKIKMDTLEFFIKSKREGKRILGYGAPAKGNTFLNYCGIRNDFLDFTVDKSPYKQNLLLPGTHIPIKHPDELMKAKPDFVFILPWNLRSEIVEELKELRSSGTKFVVAIPSLEVFS